MFAAGMGPVADAAFAVATMLIAIPTGVKIFNWLATLWAARIRPTVALHYAVGLVALFTIGGLSGIMHASPPVDLQQTDTYFVVAHFHYVLIGGSLFGLLAGAVLLVAEDDRPPARRALGPVAVLAAVRRLQPHVLPRSTISGAIGMPRRIYTYGPGRGWEFWNLVSTDRRVRHRAVDPDVLRDRRPLAAPRRAGAGRPVGRPHARVADLLAAARRTTSTRSRRSTVATPSGARSTATARGRKPAPLRRRRPIRTASTCHRGRSGRW